MKNYLPAIVTAISFVGLFYLWNRLKKNPNIDLYYHYGDSLYRSDKAEALIYEQIKDTGK